MSVRCGEITGFLEGIAPLQLAENWDNVGLILGDPEQEVEKVMVCLDVTSKAVDEAVKAGIDLIVSHHPLIFEGLKRLNFDHYKARTINKLIKNDIGVYCAHTNLDTAHGGVNDILAARLKLANLSSLNRYKEEMLYKLAVFVPQENADEVRDAVSSAGAGWIGNYSDCTFMVKGVGTFKPLTGTNPYIGSVGNLEKVDEYRLETIVPQNRLNKVIHAMLKAHPYEEVAYDLYKLELTGDEYGLGKVGFLETPLNLEGFIKHVKMCLSIGSVRVIGSIDREIKKVGVFCGSFDGNWTGVIKEGIDVLVTGDLKYHTAVDALEMGLCIVDAGHFGTERVMVPEIVGKLGSRFPGLEVISYSMEEDPFHR